MKQKVKTISLNFLETLSKQNMSAFAASIAFFFFLSMVPMMIIFFMIIPYTPLTRLDIMNVLMNILPNGMEGTLNYLLDSAYERSTRGLTVAILVTLWSAGSGTLALKRGLNAIYSIEEKWNYFLVRLFSSLYTIFMLIVALVLMLLVVFEKQLVALVLSFYPNLRMFVNVFLPFRYFVLWVILLLSISLVYTFLPSKRQRFMEQLPGAIFVSLAWSLFSYGFSWYLTLADYSVYGSLSVIIILLLWFYMCMYLLLLGAYVNFYFMRANRAFLRSRHDRRTKEIKEQD